MAEECIYDSLPLATGLLSTRVLTIMPGRDQEPIVCKLRSVNINANTRYEALSYTWGDSSDRRTVTVNATPFEVTYNLEEALRTLRLPGQRRKLWVDAICINQKDLSEKAEQIPIMGQIYRNAHRVLVWLGGGNDQTDCAIDTIKARLSKRGELDEAAFASSSGHEAWLCYGFGLKDLMFRPWWTRVWVLQEISMSAYDPLLVCGNKSLPWSSLVRFIEQLPGDQCRFLQLTERSFHILEMMEMRIRAQRPPSMRDYSVSRDDSALIKDDIAWISRTWMFESSDPRDKIYALLGLTRGPVGKGIKVDYSITISEVMRNLVRQQTADQRLDFLVLCSPDKLQAERSWLPILSTHRLPILPGVRSSSSNLDPFSRDLGTASGGPSVCEVNWLAASLRCSGLSIGRVRNESFALTPMRQTSQIFRFWQPLWSLLKNGHDGPFVLHGYYWISRGRDEGINAQLSHGRKYFKTDTGLIGLGPMNMEENDEIVVFHGNSLAFVLRITDQGRYNLIGQVSVCPPSSAPMPKFESRYRFWHDMEEAETEEEALKRVHQESVARVWQVKDERDYMAHWTGYPTSWRTPTAQIYELV